MVLGGGALGRELGLELVLFQGQEDVRALAFYHVGHGSSPQAATRKTALTGTWPDWPPHFWTSRLQCCEKQVSVVGKPPLYL